VLRQRQQAGARQTLRDLGGAVRRWRDPLHRVPWPGWNRALHRILTTGPGCNPAFQGDAISTGGSRGAWGWSCRKAVAGGETVARRGSPSAGAPAAEGGSEGATREDGPGRGAVDTSLEGGCVYIPEDRPVLGSAMEGLWWVWRPSGVPGAGACCVRTAAPPACPKTEMRRPKRMRLPWARPGRPG